jgi:DNA polymerase III alpha subunit
MKTTQYGEIILDSNDLVDLLYTNSKFDISGLVCYDPEQYNQSCQLLHLNWKHLEKYQASDKTIEEFDHDNQQQWFMPVEYQDFDIAQFVLDQCTTQEQLQRCGQELLMFQERNLFSLLKYLKYLVDTMRTNNIVWGVGRGSSVASYVLYKIGVHRIDSIYYDLPIQEFLKD